MIKKPVVVFDLETSSADPLTTHPVEVAAVVIDMYKLELIPGATFSSGIKPPIDNWDEFVNEDKTRSCIAWHAKNHKTSSEEIIKTWQSYPEEKHVWAEFQSFVSKFNPKKSQFTAPIAGGINIRSFDLPIVDRLNQKYGIKHMFWPRDVIDILDLAYYWFVFHENPPPNLKMDTLREWFNISNENSHQALTDVKHEAEVILKFLRLHKRIAARLVVEK